MLKKLFSSKKETLFICSLISISLLLAVLGVNSRSPIFSKYRFELQALILLAITIVWISKDKLRDIFFQNPKHLHQEQINRICNLLLIITTFFLLFNNLEFLKYKEKVLCECNSEVVSQYGNFFIVGYSDFNEVKLLVEKSAIRGIYISKRNVYGKTKEELHNEIAELQQIQKKNGLPPLIVAADHEGGIISELHLPGVVTSTPSLGNLLQGAETLTDYEKELIKEYALIHANDLNYIGINTTFGPVVDLKNESIFTPISQISDRAISSDPDFTGSVAYEYIQEMKSHDINTTIKHFPGLGSIQVETHTSADSEVNVTWNDFSSDLIPFKYLSENTSTYIMLSHITIPEIDADYPVSFSNKVTRGILRDKWGSENVLITDDFSMRAVTGSEYGVSGATIAAINSEVDLVLISYDPDLYYEAMSALIDASNSGTIDMLDRVDNIDRINNSLKSSE